MAATKLSTGTFHFPNPARTIVEGLHGSQRTPCRQGPGAVTTARYRVKLRTEDTMKRTLSTLVMISMFAIVNAALAQAPAPASTAEAAVAQPATWFVYGVIIIVFVATLAALLFVRMAVEESTFSLGDALSEEGLATVMEKDAAGHDAPRIGSDGKPMTMTVMVASISRVIALLGTIALV